MKSKTGKNRGRRALALLLTLIMCVSLLGNTALAAPMGLNEDDLATQKRLQIFDGWLNANSGLSSVITGAEGEWNKRDDGRVSVSKTIAPTGKENDFEVTLTVKTTENIQEEISVPDVAVTLVIDVSASMSQCAICGGNYHDQFHEFVDNGPAPHDGGYEDRPAVANDGKCDFPIESYTFGDYSVGDDTFYVYCEKPEEAHQDHEFKESIDAAKKAQWHL